MITGTKSGNNTVDYGIERVGNTDTITLQPNTYHLYITPLTEPDAIIDNTTLRNMVNEWIANKEVALEKYGDINTWDTSLVTSMYALFKEKNTFNDNISNWNTSNVTDMHRMFQDCTCLLYTSDAADE